MLSSPLTATPVAGGLLNPSKFSAASRAVLRKEGLFGMAKDDPDEAIRAVDARLRDGGAEDLRVAGAELSLKLAQRNRVEDPPAALGYYLTAVQLAIPGKDWEDSESWRQLREVYNEVCAEMATVFRETHGGSRKVIAVRGPLRSYRLGWGSAGRAIADPARFDRLQPASLMDMEGFDHRNWQEGVGGALVGHSEHRDGHPNMPPMGFMVPLNAIVRFPTPGRAEVVLHDLVESDHAVIGGSRHRLAADFTAPVAMLANYSPSEDLGWSGMLRPDKNDGLEGLFLVAPYRPDRIPLILVHGLMSTPMTWREVINACYADPLLRERYQILVYLYPTGYPVPKSAAGLRRRIREFEKSYDPQGTNQAMKNMVVVGHSMGGLLTNIQIREGGDRLWSKLFDKPVGELEVSDAQRARLRENVYFKANKNIRRVVFVCAPHRGSEWASKRIGRFGSRLIRTPFDLVDFASTTVFGSATGLGQKMMAKPGNGIDNLQVGAPVLEGVMKLPIIYKPPIHSIVGDRGKGGSPNSSDGIVPYWSAHLDVAVSEKIVPSGHSATNHPETVAEITRILYLHLGKKK